MFYGKTLNLNEGFFVFDKIYKSIADMQEEAATDGVFQGRYVLIKPDKEINGPSDYENVEKDNFTLDNLINAEYGTVWQKQGNEYIKIANLNHVIPGIELQTFKWDFNKEDKEADKNFNKASLEVDKKSLTGDKPDLKYLLKIPNIVELIAKLFCNEDVNIGRVETSAELPQDGSNEPSVFYIKNEEKFVWWKPKDFRIGSENEDSALEPEIKGSYIDLNIIALTDELIQNIKSYRDDLNTIMDASSNCSEINRLYEEDIKPLADILTSDFKLNIKSTYGMYGWFKDISPHFYINKDNSYREHMFIYYNNEPLSENALVNMEDIMIFEAPRNEDGKDWIWNWDEESFEGLVTATISEDSRFITFDFSQIVGAPVFELSVHSEAIPQAPNVCRIQRELFVEYSGQKIIGNQNNSIKYIMDNMIFKPSYNCETLQWTVDITTDDNSIDKSIYYKIEENNCIFKIDNVLIPHFTSAKIQLEDTSTLESVTIEIDGPNFVIEADIISNINDVISHILTVNKEVKDVNLINLKGSLVDAEADYIKIKPLFTNASWGNNPPYEQISPHSITLNYYYKTMADDNSLLLYKTCFEELNTIDLTLIGVDEENPANVREIQFTIRFNDPQTEAIIYPFTIFGQKGNDQPFEQIGEEVISCEVNKLFTVLKIQPTLTEIDNNDGPYVMVRDNSVEDKVFIENANDFGTLIFNDEDGCYYYTVSDSVQNIENYTFMFKFINNQDNNNKVISLLTINWKGNE